MRGITFLVSLAVLASVSSQATSPLADAVERRDSSDVKQLLAKKDLVNSPQPDGMTALLWAAYHDDLKTGTSLIKAGANPNAKNRYGVTALSLTCQNGNGEFVKLLLDAGADPSARLNGGESPLMTAARTGRPEAVKHLLNAGAAVNTTEHRGQTALMWAAAEGNTEVVTMLLEAGADKSISLRSGYNALFFAVREGRTEAALKLINSGMDVNGVMDVKSGGAKAPRKRTSPLILAVENGHFETATALLKIGADPNDQRSGFTPLHTLTWVRKPDRGDNAAGEPAPIGSGIMTSLQMASVLVKHGADINTRLNGGSAKRGHLNYKGVTPFHLAANKADVPYMQQLLKLGADPTITNVDNTPPLLVAAGFDTHAPEEEAGTQEESIEAVKLLLSLGADINATDKNGQTVMHGAAYASWPKMAHLLNERGADINIWNKKNKYDWTPLIIAQGFRPGNFKPETATIKAISEIMLAHGVKPPHPPKRKGGSWEE